MTKSKQTPIIFNFSRIWSHVDADYLVVELEGPVVDVDFLKLEVVNEVLEHVRHPDDPAAPPSAPPAPTTAQESSPTTGSV